LKDYAEEETEEYASTLNMLEAQAVKIKTISCIKGKTVKKVSGLSPKCPKGYKKK
jgi:translation initiation factor 1 (eIF-1/SUI1)